MNSSIKAQQEFTELKCKRTDDKGNGQWKGLQEKLKKPQSSD
jgi:hypothetical protein